MKLLLMNFIYFVFIAVNVLYTNIFMNFIVLCENLVYCITSHFSNHDKTNPYHLSLFLTIENSQKGITNSPYI